MYQVITVQVFLILNVRNKYISMQQCLVPFSQSIVDKLFSSAYFVDKFQELQLQTYEDLLQAQQIKQQKNIALSSQNKQHNSVNSSPKKNAKRVQLDVISTEISDLLLMNFKEAIFKQTNPLYEQKINLANINEQIQSIKQAINKMSQASSFTASGKTFNTQQSLTPQKYETKRDPDYKQKVQNKQASMFMYQDEESAIQMGVSRKNLTQDRMGSFSFMNSFLNQNRISPQQQINASISKIESSIDDRISQLQKQFTRRIEQIMKTIKNLIQMMNQNQRVQPQNPFKKPNKQVKQQKESEKIHLNTNFKKSQGQKTVSSKSTIVVPQSLKNEKQDTPVKPEQHDKLKQKFIMSPDLTDKKKQANNSSSNRLASFFGLGRLKTSQH